MINNLASRRRVHRQEGKCHRLKLWTWSPYSYLYEYACTTGMRSWYQVRSYQVPDSTYIHVKYSYDDGDTWFFIPDTYHTRKKSHFFKFDILTYRSTNPTTASWTLNASRWWGPPIHPTSVVSQFSRLGRWYAEGAEQAPDENTVDSWVQNRTRKLSPIARTSGFMVFRRRPSDAASNRSPPRLRIVMIPSRPLCTLAGLAWYEVR